MKTAIVHEWFESYAGSERVVEQMLRVVDDADLFGVVDFLKDGERDWLGGRDINTTFIQKFPFARKKFRAYLPFMPLAMEQLDVSPYDVILSSNHAVAKGVLTRPDQLHVCYIHTPIRYAWELQHEYLKNSNLTRGIKSLITRSILHYIRLWDRAAADRVDLFVANSRYIAQRVWRTYRRQSEVIYPPVDVDRFPLVEQKEDYYLAASRLVPYKKLEVIAEAFEHLPDKKLIIIGDGPQRSRVEAACGPNVEYLGYQPTDVLTRHMQQAKAFIFAAEEDFGIMPVEAQACGTPVIAFNKGGARETIADGHTGVFFHQQTPQAIARAVEQFESCGHKFIPAEIREHAEGFSNQRFCDELEQLLAREWDRFHEYDPSRREEPLHEATDAMLPEPSVM